MTIITKYEIGDTVYYMSNNKIVEDTIKGLDTIKHNYNHTPPMLIIRYVTKRGSELAEQLLFESKAALISHLSGTEL
jgi:hypothetical protein